MIPLFINILCRSTLRTIPDNTEGFKFVTIRFYHITVINVDDRLIGNPFFYCLKIGGCSFCGGAIFQMSGKAVNDINFFRVFMELVNHIHQKTASGSQHTVGDVSGEFAIGFREVPG